MSTIIIDRLYQKVSDALSDKERYTKFKKGIDTFLADNINKSRTNKDTTKHILSSILRKY